MKSKINILVLIVYFQNFLFSMQQPANLLIHHPAESGDLTELTIALDERHERIDSPDRVERRPLHLEVLRGQALMAINLINRGAQCDGELVSNKFFQISRLNDLQSTTVKTCQFLDTTKKTSIEELCGPCSESREIQPLLPNVALGVSTTKIKNAVISIGSGSVLNRVDPLGARYIMGAIESCGLEIGVLLEDRLLPRQKIIQEILEFQPTILWVSIQPLARGIVSFLKEIASRTNCIMVLGNIGSRGLTRTDLEEIGCFVIVVEGRGESTAIQLINYFQNFHHNADALSDIPNLRYLYNGSFVTTKKEHCLSLKNPIYPSLFKLEESVSRGDVINASSSYGCNGCCTFCTVKLINNGVGWNRRNYQELYYWIENVIKSGKIEGSISMSDDDLASDLEHLREVSNIFSELNKRYNAHLSFNFSTRADHFFVKNETEEKRNFRENAWRHAKESGLDSVFIGIESGSTTQLKRYGKGYPMDINFAAIDFVRSLGIKLEIGFIPIDPLMPNGSWREEMRDNLRLARYLNVSKSIPTWLAPLRVYKNAPMEKALRNKGLLGACNEETEEYEVNYLSEEVQQFLSDLGPVLCRDLITGENGYYRFKREFKTIQRRPIRGLEKINFYGEKIIEEEVIFVERLINATNSSEIAEAREQFISNALALFGRMMEYCKNHLEVIHVNNVIEWIEKATQSLMDWRSMF